MNNPPQAFPVLRMEHRGGEGGDSGEVEGITPQERGCPCPVPPSRAGGGGGAHLEGTPQYATHGFVNVSKCQTLAEDIIDQSSHVQ